MDGLVKRIRELVFFPFAERNHIGVGAFEELTHVLYRSGQVGGGLLVQKKQAFVKMLYSWHQKTPWLPGRLDETLLPEVAKVLGKVETRDPKQHAWAGRQYKVGNNNTRTCPWQCCWPRFFAFESAVDNSADFNPDINIALDEQALPSNNARLA